MNMVIFSANEVSKFYRAQGATLQNLWFCGASQTQWVCNEVVHPTAAGLRHGGVA